MQEPAGRGLLLRGSEIKGILNSEERTEKRRLLNFVVSRQPSSRKKREAAPVAVSLRDLRRC